MKATLFAMFVALLMVGCSEEEFTEGQIFIVQGSGESTKLGLVKVRVFDSGAIEKTRQEADVIFQERLNNVTRSSSWSSFEKELLLSILSQAAASSETKTDADGRFLFSPPSDKFAIVATSSRHLWAEIFKRDSMGPAGLMLSNDNLFGDSMNPLIPLVSFKSRFLEVVSKKPEEKEKKQQAVRLLQRQKSASPNQSFNFRAKPISEIPLPEGVTLPSSSEYFIWSSSIGGPGIEARFVSATADTVTLSNKKGEHFQVKMAQLDPMSRGQAQILSGQPVPHPSGTNPLTTPNP